MSRAENIRAALAADSKMIEKSGRTLTAGDLAREYGFTGVDGRIIAPFKMPENYPYR
jgi:hypothetical protein